MTDDRPDAAPARGTPVDDAAVMDMLLGQVPPFLPDDVEVSVFRIEIPPGSDGSPPHRHPGPVFGYVLEGQWRFRLEGEDERLLTAGTAFWEPGGDVIHYLAANALGDAWTKLVVVIIGTKGEPWMTFVSAEELAEKERVGERRR